MTSEGALEKQKVTGHYLYSVSKIADSEIK